MPFTIASAPHQGGPLKTAQLMRWVILATLPGLLAQLWLFGVGVLFQLLLAITTAYLAEAAVLKLRRRSLAPLKDNSALLSAVLLGLAIPPIAPWWVIVIATLAAIVIAKQLYGGLGFNLFNPAMVGYVVVLVAFPLQMTSWLPPAALSATAADAGTLLKLITEQADSPALAEQLRLGIDGFTLATPLDTFKTELTTGHTANEIRQLPVFNAIAGVGWIWVNLGFLLGGLWLLFKRVISWHIPVAMLGSLLLVSFIGYALSPDRTATPLLHLFSGASMLGAFFIATDPVSASTTVRGRLIYGALIGLMVYLIRTFGGYPDGVAFSVLLANLTVPLLDRYTQPRTYGHQLEERS